MYLGLKIGGVAFPIGNPTIVVVVAFFSGIQLLSLGVIGEYVGRIYDETRQRPKYIVESSYGLGREDRVRGPEQDRDRRTTQAMVQSRYGFDDSG